MNPSPSPVSAAIWPWRERTPGAAPEEPDVRRRSAMESAVTLGIALLLLFVFRKRVLGTVVLGIGLGVLLSGQVYPPAYRAFRNFWAVVAKAVAVGLTWVLLAPFFYLCFTTGRVVLLLARKDPLHRQFPSSEPSYWTAHKPLVTPGHYLRQY